MTSWVTYDPNKSPVQASLAVAAALETQGVKVIKMHQGAEETVPKAFADLREYKGSLSPLYNNTLPGSTQTAQFVRTFWGLPADESNTVLLQSNGRGVLAHGCRMATQPFIKAQVAPAALGPGLCWPMYEDVYDDANVQDLIAYDISRDSIADNLIEVTHAFSGGDLKKNDRVAFMVSNLPANPTGNASNPQEVGKIQSTLDFVNRGRLDRGVPPLVQITDDPYFAGLEQKDTGSVFKTPYEGNFQKDGDTPSIHVISFSKALATARPGMTAVVFTNSAMAAKFRKAIIAANGFSYEPAVMNNFIEMISEHNYPVLKDHFANALRGKYIRNHAHVQNHLGPQLLDGDPNMVCTIRIPPEALGKSILCNDGQNRAITNGREMAEYIANTYGVITVDQSYAGEPLLRLALKLEDSGQIEDGVLKIARAYDDLRNAPAVSRNLNGPELAF